MLVASNPVDGHHGNNGSSALPQLNPESFSSQIFWLIVCIATLYLVMSKILLPRVNDAIRWRSKIIEDQLLSAESLMEGSDSADDSAHDILVNARVESDHIINKAKAEIQSDLEEKIQQIDKDIEQKMQESQRVIRQHKDNLFAHIEEVAQNISSVMLQTVLGDEADSKLASIISNKAKER